MNNMNKHKVVDELESFLEYLIEENVLRLHKVDKKDMGKGIDFIIPRYLDKVGFNKQELRSKKSLRKELEEWKDSCSLLENDNDELFNKNESMRDKLSKLASILTELNQLKLDNSFQKDIIKSLLYK